MSCFYRFPYGESRSSPATTAEHPVDINTHQFVIVVRILHLNGHPGWKARMRADVDAIHARLIGDQFKGLQKLLDGWIGERKKRS